MQAEKAVVIPKDVDTSETCADSENSKTTSIDRISKPRTNIFQCYHCKRSFTSELKMRHHLKMSYKSCNLCHQEFSRRCLFTAHLETHRAEKRSRVACNADADFSLVADEKEDGFDDELSDADAASRCRKCCTAAILRCNFCDSTFAEGSLLDEHEKCHDPEKPYECDVCGQRFSLMQHIRRHIEVLHNGGVLHRCTLCHKCFRWDSCLRTHMKTHTNERPHKCSFCEYSFRRPCDLRRHMITHTNEKKFSCTHCDKLFTRNSSMLRHLRTHFGQKPYLCNVCGKRFNELFFLKEHMESHSENRLYYYCDWCNKRFNNRRVLRMHAKKHEATVEILKMGTEEN